MFPETAPIAADKAQLAKQCSDGAMADPQMPRVSVGPATTDLDRPVGRARRSASYCDAPNVMLGRGHDGGDSKGPSWRGSACLPRPDPDKSDACSQTSSWHIRDHSFNCLYDPELGARARVWRSRLWSSVNLPPTTTFGNLGWPEAGIMQRSIGQLGDTYTLYVPQSSATALARLRWVALCSTRLSTENTTSPH
ncbi:hypothetical protein BCV70DRAFT_234262 [Testicularia cyperi]|uniref:Uncharacterized protein n=1 Tax=Testicularia cyperi TaxID=1882483 RepID=A0A317XF36_9BASI|nr:hypothetical protein BCV70DRAFT_234262 [Testicularia cyperi]